MREQHPAAAGIRGNPVYVHELRSRRRTATVFGSGSRARRVLAVVMALGYLASIGLGACLFLLPSGDDNGEIAFGMVSVVLLLVVALIAPGLTATAFVGERQKGSWDLLLVTLLRPGEIVVGKFWGRLWGVVALGVLSLPLFGFAVLAGGVEGGQMVATALVLPSTTLAYAALGLVCSARSRTVRAATGIAYGIAFGLAVLIPLLEVTVNGLLQHYDEPVVTFLTCPFAAWGALCTLEDWSWQGYECAAAAFAPVHLLVAWLSLEVIEARFDTWLRGEPGGGSHARPDQPDQGVPEHPGGRQPQPPPERG